MAPIIDTRIQQVARMFVLRTRFEARSIGAGEPPIGLPSSLVRRRHPLDTGRPARVQKIVLPARYSFERATIRSGLSSRGMHFLRPEHGRHWTVGVDHPVVVNGA